MPNPNPEKYRKMYECSRCASVFVIAIYRKPESMPCLNEPLHCPFCMSSGNTLTRIHASLPDRERPIKHFNKKGRPIYMTKAEEKTWRASIKSVIRDTTGEAR